MEYYAKMQLIMQSRLERKSDRRSRQQILLFLGGTIVLIGVFFYFGVPALFQLASTISGFGKKEEIRREKSVLNSPELIAEYEATKSASIDVRGTADSKAKVELMRNNISLGLETANREGEFIFTDVGLEKGKNVFVAKAVLVTGEESEPSESYTVFYSKEGPKLELGNKDGDKVSDNPYSFNGKVDPVSATVKVNGNLAIVDGQGNFSYYMTLGNGDNKITVVATDQAGNETKQELTLKHE